MDIDNLKQFKRIYIMCAHPDDELIFFAPFLNLVEPGNTFVFCLTCKSNYIRNNEYMNFLNKYQINNSISDFKIIRGYNLLSVIKYYFYICKKLKKIPRDSLIVTHSLYGDDHFHPQHIFISLAALLYSKTKKIVIVNSNNIKFAQYYYLSLKPSLTKILKYTLLKFFAFLYKCNFTISVDPEVINYGVKMYNSQDLNYKTLNNNKFYFSKL